MTFISDGCAALRQACSPAARRVHVLPLLALFVALFFGAATWAAAPAAAQIPSISTRGEGTVEIPADKAEVRVSIVTRSAEPNTASEENETETATILRTMRAAGIPEADLQVASVRLQPHREWDSDRRGWVEAGFEAVRSVRITVRDLAVLPELVASIVDNGVNRIDGVQYMLSSPKDHEVEALRLAVVDAHRRARAIAGGLGYSEVQVVSVKEDGVSAPQPMMRLESAMVAKDSGGGNPEAWAEGTITVRAVVEAHFNAFRR